jgi:SNF2 family DNA or RNA helicase
MLNFRKLKQDFSPAVLKEGKNLHDQKKVVTCKILKLDGDTIRFAGKILGNFENKYEGEIEIDRFESQTIHSNCDCTYRYDCQHLAAMIFFLEEHIDSIIVKYSKETDIDKDEDIDVEEKEELLAAIKAAKTKEVAKLDANYQKQVLHEYVESSNLLSTSPFFLPSEENNILKAEVAFLFNPNSLINLGKKKRVDFQIALRLPYRSKPLHITFIRQFLEALRYEEPIILAGKRYYFGKNSFNEIGDKILSIAMDHAYFSDQQKSDRAQRIAHIDLEFFGMLLAEVYDLSKKNDKIRSFADVSEEKPALPSIFSGTLEKPLQFSFGHANLRFDLEYIEPPSTKLLLNPMIMIDDDVVAVKEASLFECSNPGMIHDDVYYRFPKHIKRMHLRNLSSIRDMTVPQPLFGTFVENSLPELQRFSEVYNKEVIDKFVTLPFAGNLEARCELSYLDGELEAALYFSYDGNEVRSSSVNLTFDAIQTFVTGEGILARDLVEERTIIDELFQEFVFLPAQGVYITKSEKKIVEFMTETIPRNQERIKFECPQNLLDQFIYDSTSFELELDVSKNIGYYQVNLNVDGDLKGVKLDRLWECMTANRAFIELSSQRRKNKKTNHSNSLFSKILVLDLNKISRLVHIFDEIGIQKLDKHIEDRPLWSLVNIDTTIFDDLPVKFKISDDLKDIRMQMLGEKDMKPMPIPKKINATLRHYQSEGVYWLERLRKMYLNGILADDMGLGKTLQAIVAITQGQKKGVQPSLVVCPTTLLYNWQEEIHKFNPDLKVLLVDGIPNHRKKLIKTIDKYDIIITSYTLMQKDIEFYKETCFFYSILDEAQHIKNRGTRNAKSVKMIQATHRMILTGTPIENSLEELWSLCDYLMPGFLSSYDRFVEKYIRVSGDVYHKNIEYLKKKVSPFILRRMKVDVLDDLPPVSEIPYHCQLSDTQQQLYKSYAKSARDELVKLVERDGFDKVQIHVLATLTRLKQICCHPAIFAKEKPEAGDSAKYDMLLELLQTMVEGKHKTVIFSQYTKMLQIMREDMMQKGIRFSYLDGTSKNRLQIVREFNENDNIPVFLVSLKAGGTGLNITGADTVIHYDMWWNPAVESQATDRVHRIGQTKSVSSYKLITAGTIEEKIVEMQNRKKGLVKKVVSCDDEAISKLKWEDVLELLQT